MNKRRMTEAEIKERRSRFVWEADQISIIRDGQEVPRAPPGQDHNTSSPTGGEGTAAPDPAAGKGQDHKE